MATTKTYTEREVKKLLREHGYVLEKKKGKGSHHVYYNVKKKDRVMFPISWNKMLVQRELKSHGLLKEN